MSVDINEIGAQKIKSLPGGEVQELRNVWREQPALVVFFRRWGCMLCRLWAKELSEIAPVLRENNIRLIGVGVEEAGIKEFISGNYFDGELYSVESLSTYHRLGFKRFNTLSIIMSLLWKQSREAIARGRAMALGGDLKGDWVQTGGALAVQEGGAVLEHFVQTGPADHLPNNVILELFGLEGQYKDSMNNAQPADRKCTAEEQKVVA